MGLRVRSLGEDRGSQVGHSNSIAKFLSDQILFFKVAAAHQMSRIASRKHAYTVLTPLNPTFVQ